MFGLKTPKGWIEFDPDTSITINDLNPIFDSEITGRTFSYSFKVPDSPHNYTILNAAFRLDAIHKPYIDLVKLYIDGIPYESGRIKYTGKSNGKIAIRFEDNNRRLSDELAEANLPDVVGDIMPPVIQQAGFTLTFAKPVNMQVNTHGEHQVTVNDQKWSYPFTWLDFPGWDWNIQAAKSFEKFINNIEPDIATRVGNSVTVTPTMKIAIMLKKRSGLVTLTNYTPFGPAVAANLHAYFSQETTEVAWPVIRNDIFYKDKDNPEWTGYINDQYAEETPIFDEEETVYWHTCYSPQFYLMHVLERIAEYFNLTQVKGTLFKIEDIAKVLVYNDHALDEIIFEWQDGQEVERIGKNYGQQFIQAANHLPNVTVKAFLKKICFFFASIPNFADGSLTLNRIKDQLSTPAIDWTRKTAPEYNQNPKNEDNGILAYKIINGESANDNDQLQDYKFGHGTKKLDTGVRPLIDQVTEQLSIAGSTLTSILPQSHMPGSSAATSTHKPPDLRLLIYRGLQEDVIGQSYRQASNRPINISGDTIGDLTLEFDDPDYPDYDIIQQLWRPVLRLQNAPEVETICYLDISEILKARTWTNTKRIIQYRQGKITAVIKSIQFKANLRTKISPTKLTLVRYDHLDQ
jgi:hypothetical protein